MPVIRGGPDNSFRLQLIQDNKFDSQTYSFCNFPDSCNINICRIWEIYSPAEYPAAAAQDSLRFLSQKAGVANLNFVTQELVTSHVVTF